MTPEERNLVIELFDRLATLEDAQRDPEAERLIRDGLRQAPNAPYALVQTVLVQDEALKRADARIRELEDATPAETPPRDTSFLAGVRDSAWHTGTPQPQPSATSAPPAAPPLTPGGSFLGNAAAAAAGVIGGSLLLSGIRSMMGHPQGAHAAYDPAAGASGSSPWGGSGGGELAREAGLQDIGGGASSGEDSAGRSYGALEDKGGDEQDDQDDVDEGDLGFDGGGGDGEDV